MIRSRKVLASAKGAQCTARFPGICNGDPATTVWCHLNGHSFGKGAGIKAHDVCGFAGCSACHAYLDTGHGTKPLISNDTLLECVLSAVCESYVRLIVSGVIIVPLDKETLSSERPVPARKPKDQRAPIQSAPMPKVTRPIPQRADPWGKRKSERLTTP